MSNKETFNRFLEVIIESTALLSISNFFHDESGNIVSNRGAEVLENSKMMKVIDDKLSEIKEDKDSDSHDVLVDLSQG